MSDSVAVRMAWSDLEPRVTADRERLVAMLAANARCLPERLFEAHVDRSHASLRRLMADQAHARARARIAALQAGGALYEPAAADQARLALDEAEIEQRAAVALEILADGLVRAIEARVTLVAAYRTAREAA